MFRRPSTARAKRVTARRASSSPGASISSTSAASSPRARKSAPFFCCFDITERETAEQARREFTANVSHELKTPLQGIIGSAELIENGMVKPEDMPRFIGHIRTEAQRLVALIADIIRLSQLDEGVEMPMENVELLSLAGEVAEDLRAAADKASVTITTDGQSSIVFGVRRLLYEMLYNLCDNAIKYNRPGGSVRIHVENREQEAAISVLDTGIGIAPEHQSRIFERFYRVDKSHSKASGGTGLGLSIVKHAGHVPRRQGRPRERARPRHRDPRHASQRALSTPTPTPASCKICSLREFFAILHGFYDFTLSNFTNRRISCKL